MILRLFLALSFLISSVDADEVRFSTGKIHSGTIEFELDLKEITTLKFSVDGDETKIDWLEREFIQSNGNRIALDKVVLKDEFFQLEGLDLVRLEAKAKVSNEKGKVLRINVLHDAPRTGRPQKSGKLKGDSRKGQDVFRRGTCSSCHALNGRGANIGPDLTAIGKGVTTERLIESIVAPDAALAKGFETNNVTTKDGTPHLGFVVEDDEKTVSIRDSGGQIHEIEKDEMVSRKPQSFSLMPAFSELLTEQQIADLAAFLKEIQR